MFKYSLIVVIIIIMKCIIIIIIINELLSFGELAAEQIIGK